MAAIEHTIEIQRPVSEVFARIADFDNVGDWQPAVLASSMSVADPVRIGTMISQTRRLHGRKHFLNVDLIDFQRNKLVELKGMYTGYPYHRRIELAPQGRTTRIKDTIDIRTGWLYFWYRPILVGSLRNQTKQEWEALKQLVESRA